MNSDAPAPTDSFDDVAEALAATRHAVELAKSTTVEAAASTELVLGRDDAVQTKKNLQAAHSKMAHSVLSVQAESQKARDLIEAKKRELDAMLRAMNAELEPIQKMVARMQDGISAVNLYLGRDEHIEMLRDGEPAPAETPIHLRQMVLAMDEESALFAEAGGIDFRDVNVFTEWLLADPAHLDQLLPEQRGITAVMPRRESKDYGDPWVSKTANEHNHATWWLLRNGQRLYLMTTDFQVGLRVTPRQDEFTGLFLTSDGRGGKRSLEPGSREWLKAEEVADARTRHYMKVALILQGLLDRTPAFHPLPTPAPSWLDQAHYDSGALVLIADDELALGTGRQPFREWQKERIQQADVGMRVIGHFPSYFGRDETQRIHPKTASGPQPLIAHTISRADNKHLYFTYDRTDEVWRSDFSHGTAKTRATYMLDRDYWGEITWIPIDLVTIEEMEGYLQSRSERHAYKSMFPALQAAIAFKREEDESERPFRALIAAELVRAGHAADDAAADAYTLELVRWWKTANKWHRALNGAGDHEAKAQRGILREAARRASLVIDPKLIAVIRSAAPGAMVVAARTNDLIAVVPEPRRFPTGAAADNVFVAVHEFTKTGKPRGVKRWQTVTRARVARWTVLDSDERWTGWMLDPQGLHLTDGQIQDVIDLARQWKPLREELPIAGIRITRKSDGRHGVRVFFSSKLDVQRHGGDRVVQPYGWGDLAIEGGAVTLDRYRYDSDDSWSLNRDGSAGAPSNWDANSLVFVDGEVARADRLIAERWARDAKASNERAGRVGTIIRRLDAAWEVAEEARLFARFMEDFADEALWEAHRKSIKPNRMPSDHRTNDALRVAVRSELDAGRSVDGLTVGAVLTRAGVDTAEWDGQLLALTFEQPVEAV